PVTHADANMLRAASSRSFGVIIFPRVSSFTSTQTLCFLGNSKSRGELSPPRTGGAKSNSPPLKGRGRTRGARNCRREYGLRRENRSRELNRSPSIRRLPRCSLRPGRQLPRRRGRRAVLARLPKNRSRRFVVPRAANP